MPHFYFLSTKWLTLLLCLGALHTAAHRQHQMWTTIVEADTPERLEISHRIHAEDAIQILQNTGFIDPELNSLQEFAQLALYLESTFIITSPDGKPTLPKLSGSELEGNYIFVYQELSGTHHADEYTYQSSGLMEVHTDQVNYIQIYRNNQVETLEFHNPAIPAVS